MSEQVSPLPPMVKGGLWMAAPGEDSPAIYVVAREHQNRLLTRTQEEGGPWSVVPDPRDPNAVRIQSLEANLRTELDTLRAKLAQKEREETMRAEIEALRAKIAADGRSADVPHDEPTKLKAEARNR